MVAHGSDGCNHLSQLWAAVRSTWGRPAGIICDRFRLAEMQDAVGGAVPVIDRVSRWSESSFDIRSLRKMAKDGPLSVDPAIPPVVGGKPSGGAWSRMTTQGNVRLGESEEAIIKSRDDVAAALVLVAGAYARREASRPRVRYHGAV